MSFHLYFDKQVHKKLKKKISKQKKKKKLKAWILLNQKQTHTAALRHTIYFFLALCECDDTKIPLEAEGVGAFKHLDGRFFWTPP